MQASVHLCSARVDFVEKERMPYPPTVNDEVMYEHAKMVGEHILGEANVEFCPMIMAAEDFGFYSQKIPSAMFWVGAGNETLAPAKPLHSPYFVLDEQVLPIGASLHAAVALSYLDNASDFTL